MPASKLTFKVAKNIYTAVVETHNAAQGEGLADHGRRVIQWLSAPDPSTNLHAATAKHHADTGSWLLEHQAFLEWQAGERNFLWLYGTPGCGKTVSSSTIINYLRLKQNDAGTPVLFFFFDFNNKDKQSLDSLLRSLLAQLYSNFEYSREDINLLYQEYGKRGSMASTDDLSSTFMTVLRKAPTHYLVLDAMDESTTRRDLLNWMKATRASVVDHLLIVATSRSEHDLETGIRNFVDEENFIPLQQASMDPDI